ncbi:hypothetical protein HBA54_02200 [Pelagibius litoralis]|uniref:Uncharacterized protein n=1 Tax=Pelagibius litoralis TaxID=374515 RepID=A0A967C1L6_9PROT|nr:hypothetical protein [Pelagibius litoralis]NIA67396.1 hypothetical protein [Pelagibius litoralis]
MPRINDPKSYFENLGGLHDARVKGLKWLKECHQLSMYIDDINSNFLGTPEYQGALPAEIVFEGIEVLDIGLEIKSDSFSIYDIGIESGKSGFSVSIKFAPGGRMSFVCANVTVNADVK